MIQDMRTVRISGAVQLNQDYDFLLFNSVAGLSVTKPGMVVECDNLVFYQHPLPGFAAQPTIFLLFKWFWLIGANRRQLWHRFQG